jgi:hypothetical protein
MQCRKNEVFVTRPASTKASTKKGFVETNILS